MRDGAFEVRLSESPVNFRDGAGRWQRIDNRLVPAGRGGGWRNAGNSFGVALPADLGAAPVRFEVGAGAGADSAWVSTQLRGGSGPGVLSGAQARYPEVLPGVEAVHEVTDAAAKESLLLAGPQAGGVFGYDVRVSPGVAPAVQPDGGVLFTRAGVEVFRFLPPFAVDAAGVRTDDVVYELTEAAGGFDLSVSIDPDWLGADGRVWPVLLDPTVSRPPVEQNTITGGSKQSVSEPGLLCVGHDAAAGGAQHALVRFQELESLVPSTAQVISAEVGLYKDGGSGSVAVATQAVSRSWTAAATWSQYAAGQAWSSAGGDVAGPVGTQLSVTAGSGYEFFRMTDMAQRWVNRSLPYQGVRLSPAAGSPSGSVCFRNSTHPEPNTGPFMLIRFTDRIGDLPGHTYRDVSINDRVEAKVNVYDGNLMVSSRDLTLPGVGVDLDITHTYNSLDYANFTGGSLPTRWRLSLTGEVALKNYLDGVVFFDGDGAAWRFPLVDGVYQSPPGINATLTKRPDGTWQLVFHRDDQLTYRFSVGMQLDLIADRNGNQVELLYPLGSEDPTSIVDSRGRTTTISYAGQRITKITDPVGREHTYEYSSDAQLLTGYRDPAGKLTSYGYDDRSRLISLTTPEGRQMRFGYFFNNLASLTQVTDTAAGSGPTTGFAYAKDAVGAPSTTTVSEPGGGATSYEFEPFSYRVVKTTDPLGRSRSSTYSPNDDVLTATDAMGTGATAGNTSTYGYDNNNNPTSAQSATGATSSAEYQASSSCPGGGVNTYQPKCTRSADGNSSALTYDGPGNVTASTNSTSGGGAETVSYSYTGCGGKAGQVCSVTTAAGRPPATATTLSGTRPGSTTRRRWATRP